MNVLSNVSRITCLVALTLFGVACSSASHTHDGDDAGTGTSGLDAGPAPEDAGSAIDAAGRADAGPVITDAGTPVTDAFVGVDASCTLGTASSTAMTGMLDLFGTPSYFNGGMPLPAGRYRVRYLDGCMKYGSGQGWTVNAYAADRSCWYLVGETTSDHIAVPPGTVGYAVGAGAFESFADCETASRAVAPVEFTLATSKRVGVWLLDSPYSDNMAGEGGRNPRWELEQLDGVCAPDTL